MGKTPEQGTPQPGQIPPASLDVVSLDTLKDGEIAKIQGRRGRIIGPADITDAKNDQVEIRGNARLANEIDREIKRTTGRTPKETDDLADQWLKEHGAGDLVDPNLK